MSCIWYAVKQEIEREMAGTTFNVAGTRVGVQVLPTGATLPAAIRTPTQCLSSDDRTEVSLTKMGCALIRKPFGCFSMIAAGNVLVQSQDSEPLQTIKVYSETATQHQPLI